MTSLKQDLVTDGQGVPIQGFVPDPDKAQEVQNLPDGTKWGLSVDGWFALAFRSEEDIDLYMNGETTKSLRFEGQETHVMIVNPNVTTIHFANNSGSTAELRVWGM